MPQDDPVWDFWRRWYQGALDGEQTLDPDLIKEIATQDKAFWEGSDDEVNARIAAIVETGGWGGLQSQSPETPIEPNPDPVPVDQSFSP